jgi:putative glutamate--cysteine ligase/putative amino acid ligase
MKEKDFEIRGRASLECVEMFAKGSYFSSNNYIYGGLFWSGEEDYARNWSILIHRLLDRKKKDLKALREEMANFLRNPNYQLKGVARYEKDRVVWMRGFRAIKGSERFEFDRYRKGEKFNLVVGRVAGQELDKRSGLVFLKLVGEDGTQVSREKIWEGRKKVLRAWESLTDNPKIKEELSRVREFIQILESYMPSNIKLNPLYLKLVGYVAPFEFKGFSDSLLVGRARLFWKRKTAEELIEELKSDKHLWKDLLYALGKELYNTEDEEVAEQKFLEFLKKWENEEFLKELRKDWKETLKKLLKGERDDLLATFVKKDQQEGRLTYGTFFAPSKKIKLYIFYEKGLEEKLKDFEKGFKRALDWAKNFVGNAEIELAKEPRPIEDIIPNLEKLKRLDLDNLKTEDSLDLLFNLIYFACRIKNLKAIAEKEKSLVGALLLLNTDVREANGGYGFWDYFSFVYDFFGVPVQTLNKETIKVISNPNPNPTKNEKDRITSIFKNLFISLLKDYKGLSFEFEGFELPSKLNIYIVLEKPSTGFCYQRSNPDAKPYRHFLYEIYSLKVEGSRAEVEVEDKTILLTGGLDSERDRLRRWIEDKVFLGDVRFCFITAGKWEDSYLEEIVAQSQEREKIKQKSLFVEYSELPTAHISERAEEDCFVIYTTEFERLKERLKIKDDRLSTAIAIKPASTENKDFILDEEWFYHSALQVFSTKGPGWEREEVYSEKKNLFLFSVLSLSLYESESYKTPYSKLDLWQKKKTVYLSIRRNNREYKIPLNTVLYEMLYLLGKVPDDV